MPYVFDVLHIDGTSTTDLPYLERREALANLSLEYPRIKVPPHWLNVDGPTMLEVARKHHLEGIVAKSIASTCQPGRRSPRWLKNAAACQRRRNRLRIRPRIWQRGRRNRIVDPRRPGRLRIVCLYRKRRYWLLFETAPRTTRATRRHRTTHQPVRDRASVEYGSTPAADSDTRIQRYAHRRVCYRRRPPRTPPNGR